MKNSQKVYPAKFQRSGGFAIPIIIAIVALLAIGGGAYIYTNNKVEAPANILDITSNVSTTTDNLVGGDRDAHGCIGSAGYSWCAVKNKCLRIWEEKCEVVATTTKSAPIACTMDAKQCPDGSYVGRTGPNCEFVCPNFTCVTGSYQCQTNYSPGIRILQDDVNSPFTDNYIKAQFYDAKSDKVISNIKLYYPINNSAKIELVGSSIDQRDYDKYGNFESWLKEQKNRYEVIKSGKPYYGLGTFSVEGLYIDEYSIRITKIKQTITKAPTNI